MTDKLKGLAAVLWNTWRVHEAADPTLADMTWEELRGHALDGSRAAALVIDGAMKEAAAVLVHLIADAERQAAESKPVPGSFKPQAAVPGMGRWVCATYAARFLRAYLGEDHD